LNSGITQPLGDSPGLPLIGLGLGHAENKEAGHPRELVGVLRITLADALAGP